MKTNQIMWLIQTVAIAALLGGSYFNYRSIGFVNDRINILNRRIELIDSVQPEEKPDERKKKNSEASKCQLQWQHLPVNKYGWDVWEYFCKETRVVVYVVQRYSPNERWMVFYRGGYLCSGNGILTAESGRALCEHHAETGECF